MVKRMRKAWVMCGLALILCRGVAVAQTSLPTEITGAAVVTDGDGLTVGPVRIRLYGIDAPESGQDCAMANGGRWPCGTQSTNYLAEHATGKLVVCRAREQDAYGRIVATCSVNGQDLSEEMVRRGMAWAYREYSLKFAALEDEVRQTGIGIWQAPAQPPWEYRADRWSRAEKASPNGCPIKGNIAQDGERIYHTPWSRWYSRTEISVARGERWFCDEAEAVRAGWRAARGG